MKRTRVVTASASGALLALALASCVGMQARLAGDAAVDGLRSLERYRARVSERGLLRDDPGAVVVRELVYERPWRLRAEVVAPAEHAGQLFVTDGSTLTVWWPRFFFGLRLRGLTAPDEDEVEEVARERAEWTLERYDAKWVGESTQAGRDAHVWDYAPRALDSKTRVALPPFRASLDAELLLPLRLAVRQPGAGGREWYSMTFDAFDPESPPAPAGTFAFELPPRAIVHEWDLAAPGVTLAEAQAKVSFPILAPSGANQEKIVLSGGDGDPMVALVLRSGARWLSISEMPNAGPILLPELGLPVKVGSAEGEQEGVLVFAFGFTVLSWSVGQTALTLVGTAPHTELLELAATLRPVTATRAAPAPERDRSGVRRGGRARPCSRWPSWPRAWPSRLRRRRRRTRRLRRRSRSGPWSA